MRPTSASQRMASSLAFLKIPFRRLEKVTCRLVELSILRITIFPLPISLSLSLLTFSRPSLSARWLARNLWRYDCGPPRARSTAGSPRQAKEGNKEEEIWWTGGSSRRRKLKSSRFPNGGRGEMDDAFLCVRLWEEGWLFLAQGGCNLRADFPLSATCFI